MPPNDGPLTDSEIAALRVAGYLPMGGGVVDGRILVKFAKDGAVFCTTRAEWRTVIAELSKPSTETDELIAALRGTTRRLDEENAYMREVLRRISEDARAGHSVRSLATEALKGVDALEVSDVDRVEG